MIDMKFETRYPVNDATHEIHLFTLCNYAHNPSIIETKKQTNCVERAHIVLPNTHITTTHIISIK